MSGLKITQTPLASTFQAPSSLHETTGPETPLTGRLDTDELSTSETSSTEETDLRQLVDHLNRDMDTFLTEMGSLDSGQTGDPGKTPTPNQTSTTVTAPPPQTDTTLVQQIKKAVAPPPSLKTVLANAEAAITPPDVNAPPPAPLRIPTSDDVRAQFGEAKDDIKLFGKTIKGMSTEYKAILKALDEYHQTVDNTTFDPGNATDLQDLQRLLNKVDVAVQAYHGNREGVDELSQAVAREKQLLSDLTTDKKQQTGNPSWSEAANSLRERELGANGPQYQSIVSDVRDLQNFLEKIPVSKGVFTGEATYVGDSIGLGDTSHTEGKAVTLTDSAAKTLSAGLDAILDKLDQYSGDSANIKELRAAVEDTKKRFDLLVSLDASHPELLAGRREGFDKAMTWDKALQIAPSLTDPLSDGNRPNVSDGKRPQDDTPSLKQLGKGAVNTVYITDFKENGKTFKGVVKFDLPAFPEMKKGDPKKIDPHQLEVPAVAKLLNMDVQDPQLAQRSVASYDLAQGLGFNVAVPVRFAVIDGSVATVMGKAEGVANDKKAFVPVVKMSDLQAFAKEKKAAYDDYTTRLDALNSQLTSLGYNPKIGDGLNTQFNELFRIQNSGSLPNPDDIASMSPAEFRKLYGAVVNDGAKPKTFFTLVRTNDGVGIVKTDTKGNTLENEQPVTLLSLKDFTGLVQAGRDGVRQENKLITTARDGKDNDWEKTQISLIYKAANRDGSINMNTFTGGLRAEPAQPNGQQDITVERAVPYDIDYHDGGLVRQLTELHILDFLSGQEDRHVGNYYVQVKPDGTYVVSAFDGDLSWGDKELTPGSPTKYQQPGSSGSHARGELPRVIDSAMRDKIMSLQGQKLEDLKTKLGEKLTASQIEAYLERLDILKAHIQDKSKCTVIEPDQWNTSPAVAAALKDPQSSYAAREIAHMEKIRNNGIPFEKLKPG